MPGSRHAQLPPNMIKRAFHCRCSCGHSAQARGLRARRLIARGSGSGVGASARGWNFHNPVQVHFGLDILSTIGALVDGRRYVLVTYANAPGAGIVDPFRHLVERIEALAGPPLACIASVQPNPTMEDLKAACEQLQALPHVPELLLGLGGGSVMDTTKVLAAERGDFAAVTTCLNGGAASGRPALPYLAVPTTSGTGSEVTCWATVWDPTHDRKLSLSRADLYAESVLVDPLLVLPLPAGPTLASGLDALSHALESLWNHHSNPITRDLAVSAARVILTTLPKVMEQPNDVSLRSSMALGALKAGLAFSNTRTALAHNISYPFTLALGLPHGIACSFCLPAVMRAAVGVNPDCDRALQEVFGDLDTAPEQLEEFLQRLGVLTHPAEYGLSEDSWSKVVKEAFLGERGRNFIGNQKNFPSFNFNRSGSPTASNMREI